MTASVVTLDQATHTYTVDGRIVPGVSDILDAAGLTRGMAFVSDYALDRGREVHRAIELYLKGEADDYDFDPIVVPRLNAFRVWREAMGDRLQPLDIEVPRAHPALGFAGQPDLVAMFDGVRTVCEWKNGTEHYANRIQAAGYAILTGATGRLGLYLTADRPAKPVPWTDRQDVGIFQSALTLYRVRERHGLLPKE